MSNSWLCQIAIGLQFCPWFIVNGGNALSSASLLSDEYKKPDGNQSLWLLGDTTGDTDSRFPRAARFAPLYGFGSRV